jgi:hypothetical protein
MKKKRLIYVTAFGGEQYIWMAQALVISIASQTDADDLTILIYTSPHNQPVFERLAKSIKLPLLVFPYPEQSGFFDASWVRYEIFDYPHIADYHTILYLDIDMLVTGDIARLFDYYEAEIEAPLGAYNNGRPRGGALLYSAERAMRHHGGVFFQKQGDDPILLQRHAFATCTLIFRPDSAAVEHVFRTGRSFCDEMNAKHKDLNAFYKCDQPAINYLATIANIVDPTALDGWAVHNPNQASKVDPLIVHFSGDIGNVRKSEKMLHYLLSWDWAPAALQAFARDSSAGGHPLQSSHEAAVPSDLRQSG